MDHHFGFLQQPSRKFYKDESDQLVDYAEDAETLIDEVIKVDILTVYAFNALKYNWPLSSMLINYLYSSDADINTEVFTADYSAALARVELPTLVLCGQYDFICPPELERDFFNRISSSDKSMAQSATSGHNMMFQDEEFFCREIICFIDQQK